MGDNVEEGGGAAPRDEYLLIGIEHDLEDKAATAKRHLPSGSKIQRVNPTLSYVAATIPDEANRDQIKEALASKPRIRYAEDDVRGSADLSPDDPKWGSQYAPQMVNAPTAWDTTTGDSSVTIAVLDTGIKYDHPDLSPNMDDDSHSPPSGASDPYDATNHGWDFVSEVDQYNEDEDEVRDNDPYPKDLKGSSVDGDEAETHGTHVAGILGAATDNGTGLAGISDCSILAVKGLDDDNYGYYADWADGMQWATDQGADIINMSLGGDSSSQTLHDGVKYARNNGALPVAAAGNDGKEKDHYPASYPEVVAVSALDSDGSFASYSNFGDHIEITAPGSSVYSTYPTDSDGNPADTYADMWGTSMATPVVAGVAGLILSKEPGLSVEQLRHRLKATAVDVGLSAKKQGAGRVDATAALQGPGQKWSYGMRSRHQFAGAATDGTRIFVGGLQQDLYAFTLDGSVDWQHSRTGQLADSSPTVEGTRVYVGSGGGTLYALAASDGSEAWSVSTNSAIVSTPTVANGDVYVGRNDGVVGSYDTSGGGQQWTTDVGAPVYSKPAYYNGNLFVTTADGQLVALDTTASGSELWRTSLSGRCGHASPTVANSRVYVAADAVSAHDPSNGSLVWSTNHGGTAGSTPVYNSGGVFVGSVDGSVYALDDTNSGATVWSYATGGTVGSTPVLQDGHVVIGSDDGSLYVLDATDGTLAANLSVGRTRAEPLVIGHDVVLCTWNGSTIRVRDIV